MNKCLLLAALLALTGITFADAPPDSGTPTFSPDGRMSFPTHYREWIFLSSGVNMSYSETAMVGHTMFDNVFVDPQSHREFLRTGRWPEHTTLVMEIRGGAQKGSINRSGNFQTGEPMGLEVHVKDSARFTGGWAFFAFDGESPAQMLPTAAPCYSCHLQHGAVDTTFTQFYPTLLPIATDKGTLSPGYHP